VSIALLNRLERGGNARLNALGGIAAALSWDIGRDLLDAPPAIVPVRLLLVRRLRRTYGRLGRLLITLDESQERDDHAST
jgi:hypothetical protein